MNFKKLFLSFEGRIGRRQYWLGSAMIAVFAFAFSLVFIVTLKLMFGVPLTHDDAASQDRILRIAIWLITIYPFMAIAVKRLHDRNQPGVYAGLLLAATFVDAVRNSFGLNHFPNAAHASFANLIAVLVAGVIGLAFLIELGFRRGTPGPNQYGARTRSTPAPDQAC